MGHLIFVNFLVQIKNSLGKELELGLAYLWTKLAKRRCYCFLAVNTKMGHQNFFVNFLLQMKNSFGKRTRALAYIWPKLAKRQFYHFFGGKYWCGTLKRIYKLLSTEKNTFGKRTRAWSSLAITQVIILT